ALALVLARDEVADLGGAAGPAPLVQPHQADGLAAVAELGAPALPGGEALQLVGHQPLDRLRRGRGRPGYPAPQVLAVPVNQPVQSWRVVPLGEAQGQLVVETQGEAVL